MRKMKDTAFTEKIKNKAFEMNADLSRLQIQLVLKARNIQETDLKM
ncbi:MAG: hypothetical protein ACPK85_13160 [Methanosarcina sp.]